jgi:hypothetical protein
MQKKKKKMKKEKERKGRESLLQNCSKTQPVNWSTLTDIELQALLLVELLKKRFTFFRLLLLSRDFSSNHQMHPTPKEQNVSLQDQSVLPGLSAEKINSWWTDIVLRDLEQEILML